MRTQDILFNIAVVLTVVLILGAIVWWARTVLGEIQRALEDPKAYVVDAYKQTLVGVKSVWQLMRPIVGITIAATVLTLTIAALVLALPLLWALLRRRLPLRIFVSYHHSKLEDVRRLAASIASPHLLVDYVEFTATWEHDQLLDEIQDGLKAADLVVCLPGPRPSFVQSEVMSAIHFAKPLLFLVEHPNGRLPDTAQKSFPVFRLQRLRAQHYKGLALLARYLHGDWRSTWRLYLMPHESVPWLGRVTSVIGMAMLVVLAVGMLSMIAGVPVLWMRSSGGVYETRAAIETWLILGFLSIMCVAPALAAMLMCANGVSGIIRRRWALAVVARRIRLGKFAREALEVVFRPVNAVMTISERPEGDSRTLRWMLASLWRSAPPSHHEVSGAGS